MHYEEKDTRFERRLKLFKDEVLPRIWAQTDRGFDVCVRCNPAHDEIITNLGCKPFHIINEYADYVLSESGLNKYFYDFVKWEDCLDLKQYDIQMGLDSDDLIAPRYVEKIKTECVKSDKSLHIHFQPEEFLLKTRKVVRHVERFPKWGKDGSAFNALYYPDKSVYHHCYETSHRMLYTLAERSVLIPSGYCWITIHDQNESSGRTFKAEELQGVKPWDQRPWANE